MTTLSWPTLSRAAPLEIDWALEANTQTSTSPLSRSVQTVELPGARWRAQFTLHNLSEADTAKLQAFMAKLRGSAGRFYLPTFARSKPRGTAASSPLVMGAGQTGTTLNIDGMVAATTLLAGDYLSVNDEFKIVVADATANGSGQMAVTFEPPLRASPADNYPVLIVNPQCRMMLTDDTMRTVTRAPKLSDITIDCVESWT